MLNNRLYYYLNNILFQTEFDNTTLKIQYYIIYGRLLYLFQRNPFIRF